MLSILPFDHLNSKDQDRPFKAYNRPSVSLPSSVPYYNPYPQSSYLSSYAAASASQGRRGDTMDLPMRPPPAHMYDQPQLMDISHGVGRMHNGAASGLIKNDPEHASSQYPMPPSMPPSMPHEHHGGYGMPPDITMHGMPPQMPAHSSGPGTLDLGMNRVSSSMSPTAGPATSPDTSPLNTDHKPSHSSRVPPKKRALAVPEDLKDNLYWDKRKKNNESAKRSREQRRMKEEQIAMRVVYLEQENLQLRTEVSLLKTEIEKLRCMLYNS